MGVINPREYETRKRFLVHRNIPKRAIPRMETVYGNYGSNEYQLDGEPNNRTSLEGAP
jgi:hypothetical protein